jgi:hypothetical protein
MHSLPRRPCICLLLCDVCLQFERACKEVLQDDHQLTAEGEEQHFEDVQVGRSQCCACMTWPGVWCADFLTQTCADPVLVRSSSHAVC